MTKHQLTQEEEDFFFHCLVMEASTCTVSTEEDTSTDNTYVLFSIQFILVSHFYGNVVIHQFHNPELYEIVFSLITCDVWCDKIKQRS